VSLICYNGELLPESSHPGISGFRSFTYGDGVYDTLRVRFGKLRFPGDHLRRLLNAIEYLRISVPHGFDTRLLHYTVALMESNQLTNPDSHGRIRIQVWRGGEGYATPESDHPDFLITANTIERDTYVNRTFKRLCTFDDIDDYPANSRKVKLISRVPFVMAAIKARDLGYDDAVLVNRNGLLECTAANIFFVVENELVTPPLAACCLPGITRQKIISWAARENIPCHEMKVSSSDVHLAAECFTCSSVQGINAITRIDEDIFPEEEGKITRYMAEILERESR